MTSGYNDEMLNIMEIDALIVELKAEFYRVKKSFDDAMKDSATDLGRGTSMTTIGMRVVK